LIFPLSSGLAAWTIEANFETGLVGSLAEGEDGFSEAFQATKVSDAIPTARGSKAAISSITQGTEGFGIWGGAFDFPDLAEGQEIWFRAYINYPIGFDFSTPGGVGLKTLRIHTSSATGSNEGYFDLLSNGTTGVTVASEITPDFFVNNTIWKKLGTPIETGKYHAYEQYVKFSSIPGQGIYRAWQNGILVLEDTQSKTLRSETSISDFIYLWSYWNGNAPKDQSAYVDDVVITNQTPITKDANGNPYIRA